MLLLSNQLLVENIETVDQYLKFCICLFGIIVITNNFTKLLYLLIKTEKNINFCIFICKFIYETIVLL